MAKYIDMKAFRKNLEIDELGNTDIVKVNIALEKSVVNVVEVRHGEWVQTYGSRVSCSCCDPNREDDNPAFYKFMKFCPNCGACMDGKDGADNDVKRPTDN